jgi:hypothetical protein
MFIDEDEKDREKYKEQVFNYLLSEFILSLVFCFPSFFIIKDKPRIPPSPSQSLNQTPSDSPTLIQSLNLLFTNKRFIYLLISTLFVVGYYNIIGTIINSLFGLYAISGNDSNIIFFVSNFLGMISSLIISKYVDKYKIFRLSMIVLCVLGTIFQILLSALLEIFKDDNLKEDEYSKTEFVIALILYSLISMVIIPFYTVGMNYACEITYPVSTISEIVEALHDIEKKREKNSRFIETWTWKNYTLKHLEIWKYMIGAESLDAIFSTRGWYKDGIYSMLTESPNQGLDFSSIVKNALTNNKKEKNQ